MKRSVHRFVVRLAELGWLHNQVRQRCESAAALKSVGLIGQSLIAALREELTEYYRLVAVLQSQVRFYHSVLICFRLTYMHTNCCS